MIIVSIQIVGVLYTLCIYLLFVVDRRRHTINNIVRHFFRVTFIYKAIVLSNGIIISQSHIDWSKDTLASGGCEVIHD